MYADMRAQAFTQADELMHRVAARLQTRCGGQMRDLRITIREDGLILQGRVGTYYGKQMAQVVAREVSGLAIAANEIEVT